MTVASEITRLQNAKSSIRTSIQNKWVTVPSSAKLDTYSWYVDQIQTGIWWIEVFLPATTTVQNAISNSNAGPSIMNEFFDTFSPDESCYYTYFWYRDDNSTAYTTFKVWILTKTFATNPWFVGNLTAENNYDSVSISRVVDTRMKKTWNNVIVSVLYTVEHDSSWQTLSWRTMDYKCVNMTNNTWTAVTLWTITANDRWQYSDSDVASMYTAWKNSCWMTASNVLTPLNLTSLSFSRAATGSANYDLVATINYPS